MTAVPRRAAALVVVALALAAFGRRQRAPGSCREDVDCPPGFDCRAGACARRARLIFAGPGGAPPAAIEEAPAEAPPLPARRPSEAPPSSSGPPPPLVKPKAAPPPEPAPPPPRSVPERLPAWKERLKNS